MGIGDQLIATGMARGARARGKRIAFGNTNRSILWDVNSERIFRGNPNIAPPGSEHAGDLEWVKYFKGHRIYNRHDVAGDRWIWNEGFRCVPGEMFFDNAELADGKRAGSGFILIEPNTPAHKTAQHNKQWPVERFQEVALSFRDRGMRVLQPVYPGARYQLDHAEHIATRSFRDMLAIMKNAKVYIGPEGGLHHGAAAVGIPAVVLFGGFIPPAVTGYGTHTNLTGGETKACGALSPCAHCRSALNAISPQDVIRAAEGYL